MWSLACSRLLFFWLGAHIGTYFCGWQISIPQGISYHGILSSLIEYR